MSDTKVFVVDDDEAVRDSLRWLLKSQGFVVQAFASAEAFLDAYRPGEVGCLVLDVRMPGMSGLELYERLTAQQAGIPVIFITGHGDVPMAVNAIKKGAVDFIEKPFNDKEMLALIRHALEAGAQSRREMAIARSAVARLATLTPREREVMQRVVGGKLNKQIAEELSISIKTVEVHRARVMEKMAVGSTAELVQTVLEAQRHAGS